MSDDFEDSDGPDYVECDSEAAEKNLERQVIEQFGDRDDFDDDEPTSDLEDAEENVRQLEDEADRLLDLPDSPCKNNCQRVSTCSELCETAKSYAHPRMAELARKLLPNHYEEYHPKAVTNINPIYGGLSKKVQDLL